MYPWPRPNKWTSRTNGMERNSPGCRSKAQTTRSLSSQPPLVLTGPVPLLLSAIGVFPLTNER
jgi:hypothetical protein